MSTSLWKPDPTKFEYVPLEPDQGMTLCGRHGGCSIVSFGLWCRKCGKRGELTRDAAWLNNLFKEVFDDGFETEPPKR
jgi:hypothetical protein